ncbi:MAG: SCO family protein, partial [Betaproteobacteria bacterium]|nr:SCO family protein [Betaproteobacteria bacterium]
MPVTRRHVLALAALAPAFARAHGDHKSHAAPKEEAPRSVKVSLADTPLVTQDGDKVRLKSDVMAGRIVVVDFIYTTCTTICPIFTATMASVQDRLADLKGGDVRLISMTV